MWSMMATTGRLAVSTIPMSFWPIGTGHGLEMNQTASMLTFSANPMWPWLFGNAVLSIDGKGGASADMDLGNKKPVKRNPGSDSCKVDPVQCIVMGIGLLTQYEGQNH